MIDTTFDFTEDTPKYWDGFHESQDFMWYSKVDPDSASPTMREFHRALWSRELPNGLHMNLYGQSCLKWNDMYFGADSITASFRYVRNKAFFSTLQDILPDNMKYIENFLRKSYTIGGSIIFPMRRYSINCARGCNRYICDRFDLTLECIRLYYNNEDSPLYKHLVKDKAFFDLFVNFKEYVKFFFLQDLVSEDFDSVRFWYKSPLWVKDPMPLHSVDEYMDFLSQELVFVEMRNKRIDKFVKSNLKTQNISLTQIAFYVKIQIF